MIDVWPENIAVVDLWFALDSNWRLNAGLVRVKWEPPGHANVIAAMTGLGVKKRDRQRVFNEYLVMEQAALERLNLPDE